MWRSDSVQLGKRPGGEVMKMGRYEPTRQDIAQGYKNDYNRLMLEAERIQRRADSDPYDQYHRYLAESKREQARIAWQNAEDVLKGRL